MEPDPSSSEAAALPTGITLASIAARAGAWVIDQILVTIPAMVIGLVVLLNEFDLSKTPGPSVEEMSEATPIWLSFVAVGLRVVYDAVMVAVRGRTVGMMLLRIEVQSTAGGRLEWWQAGIRAFVPGVAQVVPGVGPFLTIGVYLSASFDERRRGLHDRAAGSLVVQVPRPPPIVPPLGFPGWYPGSAPPPPLRPPSVPPTYPVPPANPAPPIPGPPTDPGDPAAPGPVPPSTDPVPSPPTDPRPDPAAPRPVPATDPGLSGPARAPSSPGTTVSDTPPFGWSGPFDREGPAGPQPG